MGVHDIGVMPESRIWFAENSEFALEHLFCVQRAGNYTCSPRYIVEGEDIPACILMVIDDGRLFVELEGNPPEEVQAGEAVLFDRRMRHRYYTDGYMRMRWLQVAGEQTKAYTEQIRELRPLVWPLKSAGRCDELLDTILGMMVGDAKDEHKISFYMHGILSEIITSDAFSSRTSNEAIEQAIWFIQRNWNRQITLDQMAECTALSKFHFSRQFKSYTGCSPYEYLMRIRFNRAKQMLYKTDDSIAKIAETCGFDDASYFSRQFMKREKQSPQTFRKQRS
jgi:AraC-like DNA-binding protein